MMCVDFLIFRSTLLLTSKYPMKPKCICCGILFADIACWPIDHVPSQGELVSTEKIELCLGGCASNVALDLTRLDIPVILAGCVGDDALSDFILKAVSDPNIDGSRIRRRVDCCPGTAMHINVQGEDRRFICTTGANDFFEIDEELEKLIADPAYKKEESKVIYLGGFLMLKGLEQDRTVAFLQKARNYGWKTLLDVVLSGERSYWDAIRPLLPHTDIFLPNDLEAKAISGKENPLEQAEFFLDHGTEVVVITQGEKGTLYYGRNEKFQTGIYPMEFVSGSGAGDAFDAGFIAAMLENQSPEQCVIRGSALGASCVRGVSTTGSVFNRAETLEFIDGHPLEIRYM